MDRGSWSVEVIVTLLAYMVRPDRRTAPSPSQFPDRQTDRRTDGRTDGQTDRQ
eukprot:COSAG03_NODE_23198_length_282_cov_0.841530_1_plen_52_part_10